MTSQRVKNESRRRQIRDIHRSVVAELTGGFEQVDANR